MVFEHGDISAKPLWR